jgi:ABC-2 type transport system ATP-binding protein
VMGDLSGRIWQKTIDKGELEDHRREHVVISSRWLAGRVMIHVLSDEPLDQGFGPVEADLQDVYFSTLKLQQAA